MGQEVLVKIGVLKGIAGRVLAVRGSRIVVSVELLNRSVACEIQASSIQPIHSNLPPANAEFLFYLFLDPQDCDALVGDLEERYKLIQKRFGALRANYWYWAQAIRSVGPIALGWGTKIAVKPVLGVIAWAVGRNLVGNGSWLVALGEIWK
jgi:hypothetical protein